MKPIRNQILGKILEPKPTKSGLILMESNLDKNNVEVLAIGPDVKHFKVGDTVRYDQHTAVPYDYNGDKCVFFKEEGDIFKI